jgi:hypothetical protein
MPNKTAQDAFLRIQEARIGSMVDVTPEYVQALRINVAKWLAEIQQYEYQLNLYNWATRHRRGDTCNCGAQDGPEHRPHDPNCNVYKH